MKQAIARIGFVDERRYPSAQGYARDKSDLYEFDSPYAVRQSLTMADGRFELPLTAVGAGTALLRIDAAATWLGYTRPPWLEFIRAGRPAVRHYLDKGSGGTRFLDISGLLEGLDANDRWVSVRTSAVQARSDAELLLFSNEEVRGRRTLVLAAHPDDAEIAAFGLYKHTDATVVTITAGDAGRPYYGHIYSQPEPQYNLKQRLRLWDSLVVPLWGGVEPCNVANLGYFDGTLQAMSRLPEQPVSSKHTKQSSLDGQRKSLGTHLLRPGAQPTWRSLVLDLVHILEATAPSIIVVPHPLMDAHSDHRFTARALFEAMALAQMPEPRLFLYLNQSPHCPSWPFGPPSGPSSLPPWPSRAVHVKGFYSHALSLEDQVDKLFALESMHDLRRPPPSITRDKEWRALSALWELRDTMIRRRLGMFSYLRRGVRSREMFFVHPGHDAPGLLAESVDATASYW
jgi:LmbE family N-acetylglucosaminyl deacetylase